MDIFFWIGQLEKLRDGDVVAPKMNGRDVVGLEASGLFGKLGGGPREKLDTLLKLLDEAVTAAAGAAAEEASARLRAACESGKSLTAGTCLEILRHYTVKPSVHARLEAFREIMPTEALEALQFSDFSPCMKQAAMEGVRQGKAMMEEILALNGLGDGALLPGSLHLPLAIVQTVQRQTAHAVREWAEAMRKNLPPYCRERDMPKVLWAVVHLLAVTGAARLDACFQLLTSGVVADILAMQMFSARVFAGFADEVDLPPGIDGKGPSRTFSLLRELLLEAARRRHRLKNPRARSAETAAEAERLLSPDICRAMARLLRPYLSGLLAQLPPVRELRQRVSVKGFDAEGFHADFIRDCIAMRYTFTVEGHGKVPNLRDREYIVARDKRDLDFYEQKAREQEEARKHGRRVPATLWERPNVRVSPVMTEEDLREALNFLMLGMPDRGQRMAVTALANQVSLGLAVAFFGREPALGVSFEGSSRLMDIVFDPKTGRFSVSATLFHDTIKSLSRTGEGEDEFSLGRVNYTQLEYSALLIREPNPADPQAPRWQAHKVKVESLSPSLIPPA